MYRLVRDQAFKAVELFVKRLEAHASTMVGLESVIQFMLLIPPFFYSQRQHPQKTGKI
jgi:hypothetical protein